MIRPPGRGGNVRTIFARIVAAMAVVLGLLPGRALAQFGDWPDVFNPLQLRTLHLEMEPSDWQTVQNDESLSIEVPAWFHADGETPILVSVRRKSAAPLEAAPGFRKVSLKVDINDFVLGQSWHGLKKLSLENGDDEDVVAEGMAWRIERLASGTQGYGYRVGHAAWVRLFINGVDTGVYLNVEQVDKRFLENRALFVQGGTWLYKVSDTGNLELREGGPQDSPAVDALCYSPFESSQPCPTPDLATNVPQYVNMKGLLTEMASDAFQANPDALLSNGKNFFFADFLSGRLRMYFPWDRDSSLSGGGVNAAIYAGHSAYDALLNVPEFRAQYSRILNDLVCGPWSEQSLLAFVDAVEPVLTSALAADVNNRFTTSVAERFASLRSWLSQRVASVTAQIEGFQPCPSIQVTLNEFMAANAAFLQDPAEPGEFPDWLEVHNPTGTAIDLGGLYLTDDLTRPTKYQIPSGVMIPPNGHVIFYADEDQLQGPLHTNFRLAAAGEVVAIYDTNGVRQIDAIAFGPQLADVSFGRFPDGSGNWGFMSAPTPGAANGAHNAPPTFSNVARAPALPGPSDPVLITARVEDDGAVTGVTLYYDAGGGWLTVPMRDDGASGDGAAGDHVYGAGIPAQPKDVVVRYYLVATDNFGASRADPLSAPALTHRYVVGYVPPALFINEFMADNDAVIQDPDEPLAYEDWIEVFNPGPSGVDLGGRYLTDDLDLPRKFPIPAGVVVPAGGYLLFWADGEPFQGPRHTNFRLRAGGDEIGLFDTDARGNVPIDTLRFGAQLTNVSQGRCPDGSSVWQQFNPSTPGTSNQPCGTGLQACCLAGGTCQYLDAGQCTSSGGVAQGTGSTCSTASCPVCVADEDCDDGLLCTLGTCDTVTHVCRQTPFHSLCGDGVACTIDSCDPVLGCVHQPREASEVGPMQFLDQVTVSWAPTVDATHWNTYRGTIPGTTIGSRLPGSPYDHTCYESGDTFADGMNIATDTTFAPIGTAHYYLVTGENTCAESILGRASSGAIIPNLSTCPTPP